VVNAVEYSAEVVGRAGGGDGMLASLDLDNSAK
jgi:hypothetical protein